MEIIGPPTVEERIARDLSAWVVHLGCIPVLVRDRPGMLVERIWLAAILEATQLLQEGIAVDHVDEALRRFGMLRGPLEQADLIGVPGLDVLAVSLESLAPARFAFDPLFSSMIEKGWLGQNAKIGFYRHDKRSLKPNPRLPLLIRDLQGMDIRGDVLSVNERRERCRESHCRPYHQRSCLVSGRRHRGGCRHARPGHGPFGLGASPRRAVGIRSPARNRAHHRFPGRVGSALGERFLPCPTLQTLANRNEPEA